MKEIAHEIRLKGGNAIVDIFREEGPEYVEIVQGAANKSKADWKYGGSVEAIEMKILLEMLGEGFEETSDREREELMEEFEEAGVRGADWTKGFPVVKLWRKSALECRVSSLIKLPS